MLSYEKIKAVDSADMFAVLEDFPEQFEQAIEIGENASSWAIAPVSQEILVLGMGGSAIGGDLLKSVLMYGEAENNLRVNVCRDYEIPRWVDENTNVIVSSYSGNTEETVTALKSAFAKTKRIVCITTGGEVMEFAKSNDLPCVIIPDGLQPRCAVGYSIVPMLNIVMKSGLVADGELPKMKKSIVEALDIIKEHSDLFSDISSDNPAIHIAEKLINKIPVIYSSEKFLSANLRWRCQLQENTKSLAFGSALPEMNHNEINSFQLPEDAVSKIAAVVFNDNKDNKRTKVRFKALCDILSEKADSVTEICADSDTYFARLMEYVYLGDWISYYAATLQGEDPTPIPQILKLKAILASTK
jgi:glucose/mannose-6-phosphate isomerase